MDAPGFPVRSWKGDETVSPESSLAQGAVRISGSVLEGRASWHVARDRLGWTTVVLVSRPVMRPDDAHVMDLDLVLRFCADRCANPLATARAISSRFGDASQRSGVGVLRIGPHGRIVELVNLSLPAMIYWDPKTGLFPYEPIASPSGKTSARAATEMLRLRPGGALLAATQGVLPHDAGWKELNTLVESLGLDYFGGQLADVAPAELGRILGSSCERRPGPRGIVVVGLPMAASRTA